ncbi:hypothetical protein [Alteromonas gracilis]|uniref:hypothetical protein n=1 Tax=Alteromonas gracilis TaxID=1479524 RepID=UPI0037370804
MINYKTLKFIAISGLEIASLTFLGLLIIIGTSIFMLRLSTALANEFELSESLSITFVFGSALASAIIHQYSKKARILSVKNEDLKAGN